MLNSEFKVLLYSSPRFDPPVTQTDFCGMPALCVTCPSDCDYSAKVDMVMETVALPAGKFTIDSVLRLADMIRQAQAERALKLDGFYLSSHGAAERTNDDDIIYQP